LPPRTYKNTLHVKSVRLLWTDL